MAAEGISDERRHPRQSWAPILGGGALALYGLTRARGRLPLALAGLAVAYYGASGRAARDARAQAVRAVKTVTVRGSAEEAYALWRNLEGLPRFMRYLKSVERTGDNRYRFTARAPFTERTLAWESEVTEERFGEYIGWRSLPESPVFHTGSVSFRKAPGRRGTEVHVDLEFRPAVAGGHLFARAAAQTVKESIRQFKELLETGEVPTNEGQPSARAA